MGTALSMLIGSGNHSLFLDLEECLTSEELESPSFDPVFHEDLCLLRSLVSPLCTYIVAVKDRKIKMGYSIKSQLRNRAFRRNTFVHHKKH